MGLIPKSQNNGDFLFLPKVGESKTVVVMGEVKRISEENGQFNYKKQGNINAGYYDVLPIVDDVTGTEKSLLINVWKFYFQLKEDDSLNVGDTITISHPERGKYTITKK